MEIAKINYVNNTALKPCSFKGQEKPAVEPEKTVDISASEALANYGKAGVALNGSTNPLDKYILKNPNRPARPHMLFCTSRGTGTYLCKGVRSGIWNEFLSDDARKTPWKMHIYADNEADWQKLATILTRYLKEENCSWKTVSISTSVEDLAKMNEHQKGKAFAIYPTSNKQFAKIAHDLNYIIKENGMQLEGSDIENDRALGDSGRIFYRYEFNSKDHKDLTLDLSDDEQNKTYKEIYRKAADGAGYLAADMSPEDDIWLNFDPDKDGEEFIQE